MKSKSKYTISLDNFDIKNQDKVGFIAKRLYDLTRLNISTPNAFFISSEAFDEFIHQNKLKDQIVSCLLRVDINRPKELEKLAKQIRDLIISSPMPAAIKEEINNSYSKLSGFHKAYVTSIYSAVNKDLDHTSFGDKVPVIRDVYGETMLDEAVKFTWAALFESKAVFYREAKRYSDILTCGVVIQKDLFAESSGVMFTEDPVNDDRSKIQIEAVLGLPLSLTQNEVTPDIYLFDKKSEKIVQKNIVAQDFMIVKKGRTKEGENPNAKIKISPNWQKNQKLDDKHIDYLARLALVLEKYDEEPLEASWVLESGKVYITQVKPIIKLVIKDTDWQFSPTVTALKTKLEEKPRVVEKEPEKKEAVNQKDELKKIDSFVQEVAEKVATRTEEAAAIAAAVAEPIKAVPEKIVKEEKNEKKEVKEILTKESTKAEGMEKLETVTKVYFNIPDKKTAEKMASTSFDGIALFDSSKFEHIDAETLLSNIAEWADGVPVIMNLGVPSESEKLESQMEILKSVRNKKMLKNVSASFVWSAAQSEVIEAKKLLTSKGFRRSSNFKLYIQVDNPGAMLQIKELLDIGVDGIIIDLPKLSSLMLGKGQESIKASDIHNNQGIGKVLEEGINSMYQNKLESILLIRNLDLDEKLLNLAVDLGVNVISSDTGNYEEIKSMLQKVETERILSGEGRKKLKRKFSYKTSK